MSQWAIQQDFNTAVQHHQAGRLQQAEQMYRQVLKQQPDHADALHRLGGIACLQERYGEAVELIRKALALRANWPEAYSNLGNALRENDQLDEAITACRTAIALKPAYPIAYNNLGNALSDKGLLDEAIAAYRQAVALRPDYMKAHLNMGVALRDKGELDAAIAAYRRAIALSPDFADAHNYLGCALKDKGLLSDAIAAFRQAIALRPDYVEGHYNLANALADARQLDEAVAVFHATVALKPDYSAAYNNLGGVLKDKGELDEAIGAYRKALSLRPDYPEAHSNLMFTLHYHPGYSAQAIGEELRNWRMRHADPLKALLRPHTNDRSPGRRLRIGYVSPDLRKGAVGRFMLPVLANHDVSGFEVFAYAHLSRSDEMTERLRSHTAGWRSIVGLSDEKVAERVRADGIDILVDLSMHSAYHRLLVFARKPAPVQVTYLAYCSSTGLDTVDYRLTDPYLDPPGEDESVYSEQTVRLPETFWCYDQSIATPEVGALPALARGHVTFGCLNNFCKVSEPTLAAWAKLLRALPNSQLLLHAPPGEHRQRVQERLAREGIEGRRVQFSGFLPTTQYFELYGQIDIALDTVPYGGGTTTCDALWMGVPVVSMVGPTAVGRAGLSILSNVGLPELAAQSEADFVQTALGLARDLPRLGQLRATLRQRMQRSPLMDAPRFVRGMEAAYRQMWQKWCASR